MITAANCITSERASKPLVKDTKIAYYLNSSSFSRTYNVSLQLAGYVAYDCLHFELTSHSHEIKFGIGDSEFRSDMPVEKQHFSGKVSKLQ